MSDDHVVAHYRIETPGDPRAAAEVMAGEQSSGTFTAVPGETEALRTVHRAKVLACEVIERATEPSLPGAKPSGGPVQRANVTIAYPIVNFGDNLPTLIATLMGNLYELREFSGLKLLDVELPAAYVRQFPGPGFGVAGTRRLAGVDRGPLVGTIIKPSVGLSPEQTAATVRELAEAGTDVIKDDELQANGPHNPFEARAEAVMRVIKDAEQRLGRRVMYAFNISDRVDRMLRHHDTVVRHGGTCVMVSLHSVGFSGVEHLRQRSELPIHGHRNGWGVFTRCPQLGVEYAAWQKLWRLAGVDHLHVNGLRNKFWESDDSVVASIRACLTPLAREGDVAMPVVSSGQWGGQAPETYRRTGTTDLMYLAGGGIMGHPGGPAAGVRAIRDCWEAALKGVPLEDYAQGRSELTATLEKFGGRAIDRRSGGVACS